MCACELDLPGELLLQVVYMINIFRHQEFLPPEIMSLIYWENVLAGDSVIPFDITFHFETVTQADHGDGTAVSQSVSMISAHQVDSWPHQSCLPVSAVQ